MRVCFCGTSRGDDVIRTVSVVVLLWNRCSRDLVLQSKPATAHMLRPRLRFRAIRWLPMWADVPLRRWRQGSYEAGGTRTRQRPQSI